MTAKTKFNQFYKQDKTKSNSIQEISTLTGIEVSRLERYKNNVLKYPTLNGYDDLPRRIPVPQFASAMLYKYAYENKEKGYIKK
jgi:hypothetical protein